MPYVIKSETASDIADAIRYKGNLEGEIKVEEFADKILDLPTCTDTQRAEKAASDAERSAKSAKESADSAVEAASATSKVKEAIDNVSISEENAKNYANAAKVSADAAAKSASNISVSETLAADAEAWAVGTRNGVEIEDAGDITKPSKVNNAKYWCNSITEIKQAVELTDSEIENMWNI